MKKNIGTDRGNSPIDLESAQVLHAQDVARVLRCSTRHVFALSKAGLLTRFVLPGRRVGCGYTASSVRELLAKGGVA